MKRLLAVLLTLTMLVSICPMIAMAETETENEYTVAWIGGSFTEGTSGGMANKCFVKLVTDWMKETNFAGADKITCINAGVGGTTSDYGRMRYEKDVLAHNPDLVIIEFAGNDSNQGDMHNVMNALESMIRRTIANNPETKIAILLRPYWSGDSNARQTAMEYHKLVADYYNVPVIDTAATVPANPDWVLSDNTHPNEIGHAMIAEAIKTWLTENHISYPVNKQFPMNPNYTPIVPVYKKAADLYDAELSTGWTVDEDGALVSNGTSGAKLYLNIKGTAFSFPSAIGSVGSSSYIVDSYKLDDNGTLKEASRKRGYVNGGGHCQGTDLEMGAGDHQVIITTNTDKVLKLNNIIVDGLAYGEEETTENLNYEVFHDTLDSYTGGYNGTTNGGGKIYKSGYTHTPGKGDVKGIGMPYVGAYIQYTLTDVEKSIGSLYVSYGDYSITTESDTFKAYATNADGVDTQIEMIPALKDNGDGVVVNQSKRIIDYVGYNIPSDTVSFKVVFSNAGTSQTFLDVKYTYADAVMESIEIDTTKTAIAGETYPISVSGKKSDGEVVRIANEDVLITSLNENVVNVNEEGTITTVGAGNAVIFAEYSNDGILYKTEFMVTVYAPNDFDEIYFEYDKTNYTEGTSGKIDFVTVKDGVKEIDRFKASYKSSNPAVLTVEDDGTFTAVSEGTATITPEVLAMQGEFESITINVCAKADVSSYIQKDIDNGTLYKTMINSFGNLESRRNGSKLFGATYAGQYIGGSEYFYNYTSSGNPMYMAFIYKLEGELESVLIDTKTYSIDNQKKRTHVAYLTDDTVTFKDAAYPNEQMTITSSKLTSYGLQNLVTVSGENNSKKLNPVWTEDANITWKQVTYSAPIVMHATSSNIPEGAKYMVVFINSGNLEDGTASINPQNLRFGGVQLKYKTKIAASEVTNDGNIALTYNADIKGKTVTVTVNGVKNDAEVIYDEETFTTYIDKSVYEKGGQIKVSVEGVGEWSMNVDAVADVSVVNENGEEIASLVTGQKDVSVIAEVEYSDAESLQLFAAYYNGDKLVNIGYETVDFANGKAKAQLNMELAEEATEEHKLRVFCWNENLKPITTSVKELNTEIEASVLEGLYGEELDKESFDELAVSEFYNNKKAAVSVTFDDGIYSAAEYYNSLFEKYNIHGTAMLVSDWVKEDQISKWQNLFDGGNIDLGNHSKTHDISYNGEGITAEMIEEDVTGGYNALKEMFPNEEIISFASPWTQTNSTVTKEVQKNHFVNRCAGNGGFVSSSPTVQTMMCLPSFVVENEDTAEVLNAKIDTAIENRQWFVHLMHGVGSGQYNINKDVCAEHFAYIGSKSDDVWAGSLNEVVKYIYEKQNVTVSYKWIRENALNIAITDALDDEIFDFPLTVKVNVPSGWKTVDVLQNGDSEVVYTESEGGKTYAYINVIPDKGNVLIKNK